MTVSGTFLRRNEIVPPCWARIGNLEFGPIPLDEFSQLLLEHSLPGDVEFRIDGTGLWWHWPSIEQDTTPSSESAYGILSGWFARSKNDVSGPYDVAELTTNLLAGKLSPDIEIQIGNGAWRHITQLLVVTTEPAASVEPPLSTETKPTIEPTVAVAASPVHPPHESNLVAPIEIAMDRQSPDQARKTNLEAWFNETMPDKRIEITITPRAPTGTLDEIIAAAMNRVATEADVVAKGLSRPWIWGGLTAMSLASILAMYWQPSGPDELEVKAYRRLKNAAEAIRAVRATQPNPEDWKAFADELIADLEPIKEELSDKKRNSTPIKELLFWAVEYRLPKILKEGRLTPSPAENHFAENLRQAEKHMGIKSR